MDRTLRELGRTLAEAQAKAIAAVDLDAQRARLLAYAQRRRRLVLAVRVASVAALAAAVLLGLLASRPKPLRFEVAERAGTAGAFLAAPVEASLPLAFSDGTQLTLAARGRARVAELSPHGARVVLERGALGADVKHRSSETRWRIVAGPFEVQVIGTRFDVSWDPSEQRFGLVLHEGQVRVSGPTLSAAQPVHAGERLDIALQPKLERLREVPVPAQPQVPKAEEPAPRAPSIPAERSVEIVAPAQAPAPALEAWRQLASTGDHRSAWRAIELEGFERVAARSGPEALALLADVARLSHHPRQAAQALEDLRARFPSDRRAGTAAFLLGRIAADQVGSAREAARWFEVYVAAEPEGPLAQEALGRLIESYEQLAAQDEALSAARRYLAAYPEGPHASLARSVLGRLGASVP